MNMNAALPSRNSIVYHFPFAPQPEIIRATQKDVYFAHYLQSQIKSTLSEILPSHVMMKCEHWIGVFGLLLYEWLTIGTGKLSLGEEYCDLKQIEVNPLHNQHYQSNQFKQSNKSNRSNQLNQSNHHKQSNNLNIGIKNKNTKNLNSIQNNLQNNNNHRKNINNTSNNNNIGKLLKKDTSSQSSSKPLNIKKILSIKVNPFMRKNTTNIQQNDNQYYLRPVSLWKRNLQLLIKFLLPLFASHYFIKLFSGSYLNRQRVKKLIQEFHRFHLAIFYLNGSFIDVSKRLLRIRYIFTGRPRKDMFQFTYHILGIIILLQQFYYLYKYLNQLSSHDKESIDLIGKVETEKDEIYTHAIPQNNSTCPLCLETRKDTTATSCGHLYCWDCIIDCFNNEETIKCPNCRSDVHIKSLCRVYHYDGLLKIVK